MNIFKRVIDIEFDRKMHEDRKAYETFFTKLPRPALIAILLQGIFFLTDVASFAAVGDIFLVIILAFLFHALLALFIFIYTMMSMKKFEEKKTKEAKELYAKGRDYWIANELDLDEYYANFPDYTAAFYPNFYNEVWFVAQKIKSKKKNTNNSNTSSSSNKSNKVISFELKKAFRLFEIDASEKLSSERLKIKFRKLAKIYHPDEKDGSKEKFNEVKTAYDELKKYYGY